MDDATRILVIILASALAIFLILSIVLVSSLIAIARKFGTIAGSAERIVENIETVTTSFQKVAVPTMVVKAVTDALQNFVSKKSKEDK